EIELRELLGATDRRGRVPAQAGVHHEFYLGPDALASGADMGNVALFAQTHRPPAELDRLKAQVNQLPADLLRLCRRIAKENGSVGEKGLLEAATKKLVDRPAGDFADDVPEGDFNAAHGLDDSSLAPEVDCSLVHALDEPFDLERILAKHA